jgi:succinate dehydrogenase/fumarate reductase cytochrome b subunit
MRVTVGAAQVTYHSWFCFLCSLGWGFLFFLFVDILSDPKSLEPYYWVISCFYSCWLKFEVWKFTILNRLHGILCLLQLGCTFSHGICINSTVKRKNCMIAYSWLFVSCYRYEQIIDKTKQLAVRSYTLASNVAATAVPVDVPAIR